MSRVDLGAGKESWPRVLSPVSDGSVLGSVEVGVLKTQLVRARPWVGYFPNKNLSPTSKSSENVGTFLTSKSLVSCSGADCEKVQNWSSWYCGPIREETMGRALDRRIIIRQQLNIPPSPSPLPLEGSVSPGVDEDLVGECCSITGACSRNITGQIENIPLKYCSNWKD